MESPYGAPNAVGHQRKESSGQSPSKQSQRSSVSSVSPAHTAQSSESQEVSTGGKKKTISAPTSPLGGSSPIRMFGQATGQSAQDKKEGFLQRVASLTGAAKDMIGGVGGGQGNLAMNELSGYFNFTGGVGFGASGINKFPVVTTAPLRKQENTLILLVIDDQDTDWSKYFPKSKKLFDDQVEIQVEQAEFSEISAVSGAASASAVTTNTNNFNGVCIVTIFKKRANGQLANYSFIPDFVLIRQNLRDAGQDYKNFLLALMYGGIPSVNSLQAIYNFQDKPWVYAHLIGLQRSLIKSAYRQQMAQQQQGGQPPIIVGTNAFPLIEQIFYPDYKQMASVVPAKLPTVLKIGHAHGGLGKIRAKNLHEFQDASSVVAVTGTYCTAEPYIETRCDAHVQKIGSQYKAFMRKNIVPGSWKSGSGTNTATMLEQIPVTERHRTWADAVSTIFGGLDICSLEMIVSKDGREFIIEVNDSATTLLGDTQEEDRRDIASLVLSRMQLLCQAPTSQQIQQQIQQQAQAKAEAAAAASRGSFSHIFSSFMSGDKRDSTEETPGLDDFISSSSEKASGIISSVSSSVTGAAGAGIAAARRRSSGSAGSGLPATSSPVPSPAPSAASSVFSGIKTNPFDTAPGQAVGSFMGSASSKASSAMSSLFGGSNESSESKEKVENTGEESSVSTEQNLKDKDNSSSTNLTSQASQDAGSEDTMVNLRKTFAGIFGDSNIK